MENKQSNSFTPAERFKILRLQQKHGFDNPNYYPETIRMRREDERRRKLGLPPLHKEKLHSMYLAQQGLPAVTALNLDVYKDTNITGEPLVNV